MSVTARPKIPPRDKAIGFDKANETGQVASNVNKSAAKNYTIVAKIEVREQGEVEREKLSSRLKELDMMYQQKTRYDGHKSNPPHSLAAGPSPRLIMGRGHRHDANGLATDPWPLNHGCRSTC
jgi:hypothetical protein